MVRPVKYFQELDPSRKDTFSAVSASLALHIGAILLLTTATALSSGVKFEESVLHVALVSSSAVQEAQLPVKKGSVTHTVTSRMTEPVSAVIATAHEHKDKIQAEQAAAAIVDAKAVHAAAPSATGSSPSGSKDALQVARHDSDRLMGTVNAVSGQQVSLAMPKYRDNTNPVYPWIARLRGYEGVVLLSAEIFPDGQVARLRVKSSSGYAVLDRSALDAVKTWKFEPGRQMGRPVSMWVDVPVRFVLQNTELM